MKRKATTILGIATLALLGLLNSVPARADSPITTVTQGGVTCGEFTRGSGFPATYWDCITPTTGGSGQPEWVVATTANSLPTTLKTGLQSANTQIFVFANSSDWTAFSGHSSSPTVMGAVTDMTVKGSTAKVAAVFATATIGGVATDLKPYYTGNMRLQLGRLYARYVATSPLKASDPFFTAASKDDELYLGNKSGTTQSNYPSSADVWGAAIATANSGKSPWEILGSRYGNDLEYVYGLQWAVQSSTPLPTDLQTALNSYLRTTKNWTAQQLFGAPAQAYVVQGGVLCVQTGSISTWPRNWWNCVRPYTPTTDMDDVFSTAQTQIPPTWRGFLDTAGVKLYAFRDVAFYEDFTGTVAPGYANIYGISQYASPALSAMFQDAYQNEEMTLRYDVSPYTSGTTTHELGHQMDKAVWNHISYANTSSVKGSVRYRNAVLADKAAYNAAGTCSQVVDADRIAGGLTAVCSTYPAGTSNWDVMTQSLYKGYKDSDSDPAHGEFIYEELWARAFARLAGGTFPIYATKLQNRMTNQHAYMNDLWTKGAPHN